MLLTEKILDNFFKLVSPNLEDLISKNKSVLLKDKYSDRLINAWPFIYLLPKDIFFKVLFILKVDNILSVPLFVNLFPIKLNTINFLLFLRIYLQF